MRTISIKSTICSLVFKICHFSHLADNRRENGYKGRFCQADLPRHALGPAGVLALHPVDMDLLLHPVAVEVRHQEGRVRGGGEGVRHPEKHGAQPVAVRRPGLVTQSILFC